MIVEDKPTNLSMDTGSMREGLHIWVTGSAYVLGTNEESLPGRTISIHLNRSEALWLKNEIERRLF